MFYCLEAMQLIDYQLVALFIIVKCTDNYREMYGQLSLNVRITIVKCTDTYRKMYGQLSLNVRVIIGKYTDGFYVEKGPQLSRNIRMIVVLNLI